MKVLVIGSGGRENAILYKLSENKNLQLYIFPGNGGSIEYAKRVNLENFEDIKEFCIENEIKMVIVGPEEPIANGISDYLESYGIFTIAPNLKFAFLEASKGKSKEFMKENNIPIPYFGYFDNFSSAFDFIKSLKPPYVIKADGLAGGKGVSIAYSLDEARIILIEYFEGKFKDASKKVVIEEYIDGFEVSAFIVMDGKDYKFLGYAKDYKRLLDGDNGPNTGGMGSYTPVSIDENLHRKIIKNIIEKTVEKIEGYKGFLFFGLIIKNNEPFVLEYNIRLGDPETQVLVLSWSFNFLELLTSIKERKLKDFIVSFNELYFLNVVLTSKGYPFEYKTGYKIENIEKVDKSEAIVFHAGTEIVDNKVITNGGRVLNIVGFGDSLNVARERAYKYASIVNFENKFYRKDIGL
ncbi:MAG: phosphoribosylamine--glycine ligase [candidate division WOR-3 bacterium]|nr:phosphoribosylamine--glycine ligase [candidate division WOR-3 bacterium]MCX7947190.1 phosphoribosylamine--glycine ligase [candidate division WOR-3 bacterium]MDW8150246.1 phosphoribosylamine--glycine ligase [candidate division WOR-3 bacterium]